MKPLLFLSRPFASSSPSLVEERAALPPLSLYIHIPWCLKKCPYCDFNSHPLHGALPESNYLAALLSDLESALPLVSGRRIVSIFLGGGTPSLFSAAGIDTLLAAVRARLPLDPGAEITLEANPGAVEAGRFGAFREAGINRLSLGIQSFDPRCLKSLGRIHDGDRARRAAALAAQHFDNFNLDLMYGLPGQGMAQALADVEEALSFAPSHLSCYQLTLEAGTAFAAAPPALPDPDLCADMQEAIEARLEKAGFVHYETSAFARPGKLCRHNLNYWTFGDYLGIGAGAHGKLTRYEGKTWKVCRQTCLEEPGDYLAEAFAGRSVRQELPVDADDTSFEFMMNALRLAEGFAVDLFEARTAQPLAVVEAALCRAENEGLLVRDAGRIAPTRRGQRFLNRLLSLFLA